MRGDDEVAHAMTTDAPRRRRWLRRLSIVAGVVAMCVVAVLSAPLFIDSFGGRVQGQRLERARATGHHRDGQFQNLVPTALLRGGYWDMVKRQFGGSEQRVPAQAVPIEARTAADYQTVPRSGLRATWIGHASTLIEIDGKRVLTDPVWSERCSPVSFVGPRRFHAPPIPLDQLPPIDAAVISHDHFDHLDMDTVKALAARGTTILVPLGIGAHLEAWKIPAERFVELDWWQSRQVAGLTFTSTPSRHYSGRFLGRGNTTLWTSWAIVGPQHRVYFSGDTGYAPTFAEIGAKLGPFDLTVVKVGAYGENWPEIHVTPEEAVRIHADVRGRVMLPVHWGTFNLAYHRWNEPADRIWTAAREAGVSLVVPRPGQWFEPAEVTAGGEITTWWR
jgi:L-ascorbate metabolism protein UlaG (beta-lactamase superfamily)